MPAKPREGLRYRQEHYIGHAEDRAEVVSVKEQVPLLKAELELALRRPRSAPELEDAIRSAAAETDRLAGLADDLLLLARSDQGELVRAPKRSPRRIF